MPNSQPFLTSKIGQGYELEARINEGSTSLYFTLRAPVPGSNETRLVTVTAADAEALIAMVKNR